MHEDLELLLGGDGLDLTPLELVTRLLSSGLPVALTINTPHPGRLSVVYRGQVQMTFPISALFEPQKPLLEISRLVEFPNIYKV
jgi:hypothetical protein